MRLFLLMIAIFISCSLHGQQISGLVTDKQSGEPIEKALISSSKGTVLSNILGRFEITVRYPNDTIRISAPGYSSYQLTDLPLNQLITIALNKQIISLNEVKIFAKRDRVKDSLANRAMFAKSFNSAAPKFGDIVRVSKGIGPVPIAGITIIPSELFRAITYKQSKVYKFKKTLLKDEDDKYIDSRFSRDLITKLTKLQTDSLSLFIEKYRPDIKTIKKMSSYDVMIYIKKSFLSFKNDG